jgi:hypothetical protein
LAFTTSQLNKIAEAFNNQKGITIKMSKTQVEHNKQIEGGFILLLLGAVASAVLPYRVPTDPGKSWKTISHGKVMGKCRSWKSHGN